MDHRARLAVPVAPLPLAGASRLLLGGHLGLHGHLGLRGHGS
jgi:hypothetical protein